MNCLEFRRQLAIDPATPEPAFVAHRESCARCAAAAERAVGFEHSLVLALAVPVPDGLAERILLRQTTSQRTARVATRFVLWRMAAVLVLGVGAAAFWFRDGLWQPDLADLAVAHMAHEPYALSARGDVAANQVRAVFERTGVRLVGQPGRASYLQYCKVGEHPAVHMVTQRAEGPVTVLFVTGADENARRVFTRDGLKGRLVPMPQGTLLLLASSDEGFDEVELAWGQALGASGVVALAAR